MMLISTKLYYVFVAFLSLYVMGSDAQSSLDLLGEEYKDEFLSIGENGKGRCLYGSYDFKRDNTMTVEACAQLCFDDADCEYFAAEPARSCERYTNVKNKYQGVGYCDEIRKADNVYLFEKIGAKDRVLGEFNDIFTYKNRAYCEAGYYKGYADDPKPEDMTITKCAAICEEEKECEYFAVKQGQTCSRYTPYEGVSSRNQVVGDCKEKSDSRSLLFQKNTMPGYKLLGEENDKLFTSFGGSSDEELSRGRCMTGNYKGHKDDEDYKTMTAKRCADLCEEEDECQYFAVRINSSCMRYTNVPGEGNNVVGFCEIQPDNNHFLFKKNSMDIKFDFENYEYLERAYCKTGRYRGYNDDEDVATMSIERCAEICDEETGCEFFAYWAGRSCSRFTPYHGLESQSKVVDDCTARDKNNNHLLYRKKELPPFNLLGEMQDKFKSLGEDGKGYCRHGAFKNPDVDENIYKTVIAEECAELCEGDEKCEFFAFLPLYCKTYTNSPDYSSSFVGYCDEIVDDKRFLLFEKASKDDILGDLDDKYDYLGRSYCDAGYYKGWTDDLNSEDMTANMCAQLCSKEAECEYFAVWAGKTCSRYTPFVGVSDRNQVVGDCTEVNHPHHLLYKKQELDDFKLLGQYENAFTKFGDDNGYCKYGEYKKSDVDEKVYKTKIAAECAELCGDDEDCQFMSFTPGYCKTYTNSAGYSSFVGYCDEKVDDKRFLLFEKADREDPLGDLEDKYDYLGRSYCNAGYYKGWADDVDHESMNAEMCAQICSEEDECLFFAVWGGKTCSRYTPFMGVSNRNQVVGDCTKNKSNHPHHLLYKKQELADFKLLGEYTDEFIFNAKAKCMYGYYKGNNDDKDRKTMSAETCAEYCSLDEKCEYFSFRPGVACNRYTNSPDTKATSPAGYCDDIHKDVLTFLFEKVTTKKNILGDYTEMFEYEGRKLCKFGKYAGDADDDRANMTIERCAQRCDEEDQCEFISVSPGQKCMRFSPNEGVSSDNRVVNNCKDSHKLGQYITFKLKETKTFELLGALEDSFKSKGKGYCMFGYYKGYKDDEDSRTMTGERCAEICKSEPECKYFALRPGHSCSRYTNSILGKVGVGYCTKIRDDKNHYLYEKKIEDDPVIGRFGDRFTFQDRAYCTQGKYRSDEYSDDKDIMTSERCADICNTEPECKFFSVQNCNKCHRYTPFEGVAVNNDVVGDCEKRRANPGFMLYEKNSMMPFNALGKYRSKYEEHGNGLCKSGQYARTDKDKDMTPEKCAGICEEDPNCVFFVVRSENSCWRYTNNALLSRNRPVVDCEEKHKNQAYLTYRRLETSGLYGSCTGPTARWSGDPHMTTFDGFKYDCQGAGEFVIAKSLESDFEVRGRFQHPSHSNHVTVTRGLAFNSGGIGEPTVSLTVPDDAEKGEGSCDYTMHVGDTPVEIGSIENVTTVAKYRNAIHFMYMHTGVSITVYTRGHSAGSFGCVMNVQICVPPVMSQNETVVGLLGTPNDDTEDEFMDRNGEKIDFIGENYHKNRYDYCVQNWCIKDPEDSFFVYDDANVNNTFSTYDQCDVVYDDTLENLIRDIPEDVQKYCNYEIECMTEAAVGSLEDADALEDADQVMEIMEGASLDELSIQKDTVDLITAQNAYQAAGAKTRPQIEATNSPTSSPTASPTSIPTASPTSIPTSSPTSSPTASSTSSPTSNPTVRLTNSPTVRLTNSPTTNPTSSPTTDPTSIPTTKPTAPAGYEFIAGGCNKGGNYNLLHDQSVSSCAEICKNDAGCLSFELFREQDGTKTIHGHAMEGGDCYLQSGNDHEDCDGYLYNVDLFVKLATVSPTVSPTASAKYAAGGGKNRPPTASPAKIPDNFLGAEETPTNIPVASTKIGGARGDPHIKTWNGELYDFHGICDLVLLRNPDFENGLGMEIHMRSKKTRKWSYISTAVIQIGVETFEISAENKHDQYWINGVSGEETFDNGILPMTISEYGIKFSSINAQKNEYVIDLGDGERIVFSTWKNMVRIDVDGYTPEKFASSVGLMGAFSNSAKVGRDNSTIFKDVNQFGQEWQVLPGEPKLFHSIDGPQAPTKCEIPSKSNLRRRLAESGLAKEQAEKACSFTADKQDFDLCVFDIMATGDLDIAGAY